MARSTTVPALPRTPSSRSTAACPCWRRWTTPTCGWTRSSSPTTCAASRCGRSSPPRGRAGCGWSGRSAHRVKVLAGNGRHDQGVLADVVAPRMEPVDEFLAAEFLWLGNDAAAVLVLDRLTNPANVGMILRSATAAGLDGVLLPRRGAARDRPAGGQGVGRGGVPGAGAAGGDRRGGLRGAARRRVRRARAGRGRVVAAHGGAAARVALVLGNETNGLSRVGAARCWTGCWRSPCTPGWSR